MRKFGRLFLECRKECKCGNWSEAVFGGVLWAAHEIRIVNACVLVGVLGERDLHDHHRLTALTEPIQ